MDQCPWQQAHPGVFNILVVQKLAFHNSPELSRCENLIQLMDTLNEGQAPADLQAEEIWKKGMQRKCMSKQKQRLLYNRIL